MLTPAIIYCPSLATGISQCISISAIIPADIVVLAMPLALKQILSIIKLHPLFLMEAMHICCMGKHCQAFSSALIRILCLLTSCEELKSSYSEQKPTFVFVEA